MNTVNSFPFGCTALAAVICGTLSSTASAALISHNHLISNFDGENYIHDFDGGPFSTTYAAGTTFFTLPRFDSTLGTLQGVSLSLNSTVGIVFLNLYANAGGDSDVAALANVKSDFILAPFDPDLPDAVMTREVTLSCQGQRQHCNAQDTSYRADAWYDFDFTFNTGSAGLAAFIGDDPMNFYTLISTKVTGICAGLANAECTVNHELDWFGQLTVGYTYLQTSTNPGDGDPGSPVSVPEPGTLGLALVGVAAMAISRRNPLRKNSFAAPNRL
jgi:hypothetical protein